MGSKLATTLLAAALAAVVFVPIAPIGAQVAHPLSPRLAEPALPWLSVAHPKGQPAHIVDPEGRTVMLRGVNVTGIEDDFYATPSGAEPGPTPVWPLDTMAYAHKCPTMSHAAGEAPLCEVQAGLSEFSQSSAAGSHNDLAQMRALGFNFIRLTLSWSQLEPTPGRYSQTYLDRIAQVVGWARQQGIHVLLDMHQDNYSRFTPESSPLSVPGLVTPSQESSNHADGAPRWAVMADGIPALSVLGQGELNLYVEAAFNSFWENRVPLDAAGKPLPQGDAPGPGLQDHYIGAMAALARTFKGDSTVVGYEIMNEPLPGLVPPVAFSTLDLYPFYRRVIDALTGRRDGLVCPAGGVSDPLCGYPDLGIHVDRQAFFFEPMAIRNLEDAPDQVSLPFSSYPNLVYAPHVYTHVFTVDRMLGLAPGQSPYPLSYDQAYIVAGLEARAMNAALLVDEYGNSASDDNVILRGSTAAQDRHLISSSVYAWKGACNGGTQAGCDASAWSVYSADAATPPQQNLGLLPSRVKFLDRIYPRATAGHLDTFSYNPDNRSFAMSAHGSLPVAPGQRTRETVVFIPSGVSGNVRVSGAAVLDGVSTQPDGTKLAYVAPTGSSPYSVTVAAS
ncbi:MAG: cellulase family glycosylhydrolase [Acidimicrobiales bacterium]